MTWTTIIAIAGLVLSLISIGFNILVAMIVGRLIVEVKATQTATSEGFGHVDKRFTLSDIRVTTVEKFLVNAFGLKDLLQANKDLISSISDSEKKKLN